MRLLKITILASFIVFSAACYFLSGNKITPTKNLHHAQKTFRQATAENVKGDFERDNRFEFGGVKAKMSKNETDFFISFETGNLTETYKIEAIVGAKKLEEYIVQKDKKFIRLPIAYDLIQKHWINLNSTFFETDNADFFKYQKDWETNCTACHLEIDAQNIPTDCAACHSKNLHESENAAIRLSSREHQGILRSVCFVKNKGGEVINCLSCHSSENPSKRDENILSQTACTNCHQQFNSPEIIAEHTKHPLNSEASSCYSCHLPEIIYGHLEFQKTHEISIPNPELTAQKSVPNACNLCHTDKSVNWAILQTKTLWAEHFRDAKVSNDSQFNEAESIRGLFAGDALTRALSADALTKHGEPNWFAPFALEAFQDENYPLVRYFLVNALAKNINIPQPDYLASQTERTEILSKLFQKISFVEQNRLKTTARKLRLKRKTPDLEISE